MFSIQRICRFPAATPWSIRPSWTLSGARRLCLRPATPFEEWRTRGNIIIAYDYPWTAGLRKPLTIAAAMFGVYFTTWIVGNLDVRIGKK